MYSITSVGDGAIGDTSHVRFFFLQRRKILLNNNKCELTKYFYQDSISFSHGSRYQSQAPRLENIRILWPAVTAIPSIILLFYCSSTEDNNSFLTFLSDFDCCRRLSSSRIAITGGTDRNILPGAAISCI